MIVATPLWPNCGGEAQHLKKFGIWSPPECLKLDSKGQNTSQWGVLGVIGKGIET
jgi:hypothetical protein